MSKTEKRHAGKTAKTGGARATAGKAKRGSAAHGRAVVTKGGTVFLSPDGVRYTAAQKWRTVRTRRGLALRSPDGVTYYGTAAEVRAARLFPWEREGLAKSLRIWHACCAECREELRRIAADRRRESIKCHEVKARTEGKRACDREILVAACARYLGMGAEEFESTWIDAGISAAIDEMPDGGEFLTRHEREAMSTPLYEWSDSLFAKRVMSERRAEGKERRA